MVISHETEGYWYFVVLTFVKVISRQRGGT